MNFDARNGWRRERYWKKLIAAIVGAKNVFLFVAVAVELVARDPP